MREFFSSKMIFLISMSLFFFVSCRNQVDSPIEASQQNFGAPGLMIPDDIYCPEGYNYDASFHYCVGQLGVLGPFSSVMIEKCKVFGGGDPCEGLHWDREFAEQIRGREVCPPGSEWNSALTVCAQGQHVYGPFLKTQHDLCVKSGGGPACATMRWSRDFFVDMRNDYGAGSGQEPNAENIFNFREPTDSEILRVRSAWATHYQIPTFRDAGNQGYPLLDMTGRSLGASLHSEDWCHASLEGSVRVLSHHGKATVFNYIGNRDEQLQVDCSPWVSLPGLGYSRFYKAKGEFGDGVNGYVLRPYRTIAVDPSWVAFGTVLFVPAARGTALIMPDGSKVIHDGYFFVGDTGGALYGNHLDVFIGSAEENPFKFVRSSKSYAFEIYVIQNQRIQHSLESQHRGSLR